MAQQTKDPATALAVAAPRTAQALSVFGSIEGFESAQRMAKALASSDLVPDTYKGEKGMGNCLIAMEVASRVGASILAVTQNLHIIQGRPSWSSAFVIAALNSCGRFTPVRFTVTDGGQKEVQYEYWDGPKGQRTKKTGKLKIHDKVCVASCRDASSGDVLDGPPVSLEMAVQEGWYTKTDSKWKTMPDLMLRYRAAAFFGRLYAPDILMGMHTQDEVEDVGPRDITPKGPAPELVDPSTARPVEGEVLEPAKPKGGKKAKATAPEPEAPTTDATDASEGDAPQLEQPQDSDAGEAQGETESPTQGAAAPAAAQNKPAAAAKPAGDLF